MTLQRAGYDALAYELLGKWLSEDVRIRVHVRVDGRILETNARYLNPEGSGVTLLSVDFEQWFADPEALAQAESLIEQPSTGLVVAGLGRLADELTHVQVDSQQVIRVKFGGQGPGAYEDTVISEIGNVPPPRTTSTLSADAAELWEGTWDEESWMFEQLPIRFRMEINAADELGFKYQSVYQDVPYGPNWVTSAVQNARFDGPRRAVDPATGHVFILTIDPADRGDRFIDVIEGDPGTLGWSPAGRGPETLAGRWIFERHLFRAGLDCDEAATPVEITICRDELLARGDFEMSELYRELIRSVTRDRERSLRASQRGFLTKRDSDCRSDDVVDRGCLARLYADRIVALQRLRDPSLGDGSRFDTKYAVSILANGVDLRQNTAARLAMYPLDMEAGTAEWRLDANGLLYEQSYVDTRVVWPAEVAIRYSDMFFVGVSGEVFTAAHMAPADSVAYSAIQAEYGFAPWRVEQDGRRAFLSIWRETEEGVPDLVRDWLNRHPIPDLEAWD